MNPGPPEPQPTPELRSLRHDIRGRMNALVLCTSALDESLPAPQAEEFLTDIEKTADKMIALLDRLDSMVQ